MDLFYHRMVEIDNLARNLSRRLDIRRKIYRTIMPRSKLTVGNDKLVFEVLFTLVISAHEQVKHT